MEVGGREVSHPSSILATGVQFLAELAGQLPYLIEAVWSIYMRQ